MLLFRRPLQRPMFYLHCFPFLLWAYGPDKLPLHDLFWANVPLSLLSASEYLPAPHDRGADVAG